MEIFYVDSIRLYLCFQTECISLGIYMSVLTIFMYDEITCIKLYTWAVSSNIHSNTALIAVCSCDQSSVSFCVIVCYIVMIISACIFQLIKVCVNILADLFGCSEVHRSSCNFFINASRNRMAVCYRCVIFCMESKILIHCTSASFPIQIEIRMVCHICDRRFIADTLIVDLQFILFCKFILNRYVKFSRISILSIRTDAVKYNTVLILRNLNCFPEFLFKSVRTAVQVIVILILRKHYFFTINGEFRSTDTVAASSDRCTKKASIYFIGCQIVISKYHICQGTLFIRHTYLYKDCSKICHFCVCSGFVLQMINLCTLPGL